jgi:hypothetical protein
VPRSQRHVTQNLLFPIPVRLDSVCRYGHDYCLGNLLRQTDVHSSFNKSSRWMFGLVSGLAIDTSYGNIIMIRPQISAYSLLLTNLIHPLSCFPDVVLWRIRGVPAKKFLIPSVMLHKQYSFHTTSIHLFRDRSKTLGLANHFSEKVTEHFKVKISHSPSCTRLTVDRSG